MDKIAIKKTEYRRLRRQADAYKKIAQHIHASILRDAVHDVVEDFKKTSLYSEAFLGDLETGLRKSSYAKKK